MDKVDSIQYISNSEIQSFLACPFSYYNKHIKSKKVLNVKEKGYLNLINVDYMDKGRYVHRVLELYVNGGLDIFNIAKQEIVNFNIELDYFIKSKKIFENFLKRSYLKYRVLSTEKTYYIILPNGVACRGTIDLLMEVNKDTILISDTKSGSYPMTQSFLENSMQMKMYSLMVRQLFPQYKNIIAQIDAIGINEVFEKKVTNDWLDGVEDYLDGIYQNIINMKSEKDFKPKFSSQCSYCEYYPICPLMKDLNTLKINPIVNMVGKNLNYLAEKYLEYSSVGKIAGKNLEIVKDLLLKLLRDSQTNIIEESWGEVKLSGNRLSVKLK